MPKQISLYIYLNHPFLVSLYVIHSEVQTSAEIIVLVVLGKAKDQQRELLSQKSDVWRKIFYHLLNRYWESHRHELLISTTNQVNSFYFERTLFPGEKMCIPIGMLT